MPSVVVRFTLINDINTFSVFQPCHLLLAALPGSMTSPPFCFPAMPSVVGHFARINDINAIPLLQACLLLSAALPESMTSTLGSMKWWPNSPKRHPSSLLESPIRLRFKEKNKTNYSFKVNYSFKDFLVVNVNGSP